MSGILQGIYGMLPIWLIAIVAIIAALLKAYRFYRNIPVNRYELLVAALVLLLFGSVFVLYTFLPGLPIEARGGGARCMIIMASLLSIGWDVDAIGDWRKWSNYLRDC